MYKIVATNPGGTQYIIYDPVGTGPLPVLAPRITEELNEAGSLEFALVRGHSAFGKLTPKQTYFSVTLDGSELFYGRLLSAEPSPLGGQIQYTVAGALSFLQDGEMAPDPKNEDGSYAYQTMTAEAFFRRCITAYNEEIDDDSRRKFYIGTINAKDKGKEREYQISSYTNFSEVIRQNIIDRYGGFLRVRKRSAGGHYIDWVEQYGSQDNAILSIGQNILSITNHMNGEDLISAIRPIGKDGLTLSGDGTINLFSSATMSKYGKIIRSVQLGAAETEEELRSQAESLISAMHKGLPKTSEIGLVDLHFADSAQHGVKLGDVFTQIAGLEGEKMTVSTRNRDFENPQNDSVSLKNAKELEGSYDISDYKSNKTSASGDTLSRQTARAGGAGGMAYKYIHETQDNLQLATKHIAINAEELEIHADIMVETANEFARLSHQVGTIEDDVGTIKGTGVIQNSDFISNLAGQFQYDPTNHRVSLINGTELRVTEDGAQISVGKKIADLTKQQAAFEGSALWTQRNNITGIVGEFDIVTGSDGKRTLRVKSGGGISVLRDNVTYGLYDNGNLTAGAIVQKINGQTTYSIKADRIELLGETIANTITASFVQSRLSDLGIVKVASLSSTGGITCGSGSYGITTFGVGTLATLEVSRINLNGNASFSDCLIDASVSLNDLTLTLTKASGGTITFSKATTLSGKWGGGTYTVTASPQNVKKSTTLTDVTTDGSPTISSIGDKYLNQPVKVINESSVTVYTDTVFVNASDVWDKGNANGVSSSAPSGATLGTKVTGTTWNVNIQRSGGYSPVGKTIDLSNAYKDARSGYYTAAQYNARYKEGWNDCRDAAAATGQTALVNFEKWSDGNQVYLYVAPTGGASPATGEKQRWIYKGSIVTRYTLPAAK